MMKIDLWVEGYAATGQSAPAMFCGSYLAKDLKDAIKQYQNTLIYNDRSYINIEKETFWGCRFFDNERAARKLFG